MHLDAPATLSGAFREIPRFGMCDAILYENVAVPVHGSIRQLPRIRRSVCESFGLCCVT